MHLLVLTLLNVFESLLVELDHLFYTSLKRLQFLGNLLLKHLLDDAEVSAVRDVADSSHYLKLCCTLVDREDTCIAIQTLALVLHNEARTTVYLDGIVGVLVGILRVHTLCQRSEGIGKTRVLLKLLALLGCKLALTRDVLKGLVDINVACCLVEDRAACVEFSLDAGYHIVYGRELYNLCIKLLALACILQCLVVGSLANANRLGCDAKTCAVHKSQYVLDKSETCRTAKLCLCILVYKLASRRTMDTKLVLDVAYCYAAVALVVDKHRQATSVACALFRTCKHEVDVRVAIGDESLNAIQAPCTVLVLCSLEHNTLKV